MPVVILSQSWFPSHKQEFFSSAVTASETEAATATSILSASSHSSVDFGSFRVRLKGTG